MSVLFVCYGNACRSPMAEGLARLVLGEKVKIASAGLAPLLDGATPEAIQVLRDHFGVDISSHKARSVADTAMDLFDRIVVLDAFVFHAMKSRYASQADKFILWNISDPYGQDLKTYRKTAERIKKLIENRLAPLYGA